MTKTGKLITGGVVAIAVAHMGGVPEAVLSEIVAWYQSLDPQFVEWFVGFAEGDGGISFYDYSGVRRAKDVIVDFSITQSTWNIGVLEYIRDQLGFGAVRLNDAKGMTHQYIVRDAYGLLKIMFLMTGMLQLDKKKEQYGKFLEGFNRSFGYRITAAPSQNLLSLRSPWLTGFTEAEGCFTVTVQAPTAGRIEKAKKGLENRKAKAERDLAKAEGSLSAAEKALANNVARAEKATSSSKPGAEAALAISRERYEKARANKEIAEGAVRGGADIHVNYQIFVRYVITQLGEARVLGELATLLGGTVSGKNMTVHLQALGPIVEYLGQYPMRGRKQEAYEVWCRIRTMTLAKKHLTEEGLEQIRAEVVELRRLNGNKGEMAKAEQEAEQE